MNNLSLKMRLDTLNSFDCESAVGLLFHLGMHTNSESFSVSTERYSQVLEIKLECILPEKPLSFTLVMYLQDTLTLLRRSPKFRLLTLRIAGRDILVPPAGTSIPNILEIVQLAGLTDSMSSSYSPMGTSAT